MARHEFTERRRNALLQQLQQADHPLSVREIMQRARLHPGERTDVKRMLRDLAREGVVTRDGKRFALPRTAAAPAQAARGVAAARGRGALVGGGARRGLVGTLHRNREGFGFVARLDRRGEDVYVPPQEAGKALDGDIVRIEIVPGTRGRSAGRIVEVIERRRRLLLGTYHARGRSSFVVPADPEIEGYVPVTPTRAAHDGDIVKVGLAPGAGRLAGDVIERVGEPGEPRAEVLRIAYAKGFADVFPEPVRAEAEAVPDRVLPREREGRRDLTDLRLVTIDGEDARDFDDAVYVERVRARRGGARYRLVVAIADVAHYVRPGSALDDEALRRGTSVYFPRQVLPMLPERLSNGVCSLNPDVERLSMVTDLRVDARGRTVAAEVYEAVIRSHARCTYTEVARVLSGERVPNREKLRSDFELMAELQEKLTAMRARRGSIDFDLPEAKVVLDDEGRVAAIERRPRNRAHRIVEDFMLAANEAVARWFGERELPTIYRVHDLPDEEKLRAFADLARAHGFEVPEERPGPGALNRLLARFEGHPQQRALNQLLLRAMMQALYSEENIGHFGLAAEHYLHFTSPIRRYPDLMVHRLLKEEWHRREGAPERRRHARERDLAGIAALSSERERAAMQAEREVHAYHAALFMREKVGEQYRGVVSAVVDFGIFVELEQWLVEGLVKAEDLGPGFVLDPRLHALVERRSGRAFRVGDEVEVEVVGASPARRQIDFALVEGGEVQRAATERPGRRRAGAVEAGPRPRKDQAVRRRGGGRRAR